MRKIILIITAIMLSGNVGVLVANEIKYCVSDTSYTKTYTDTDTVVHLGSEIPPLKNGCLFLGWYEDSIFSGSPITEITLTSDTTFLYAKRFDIVEEIGTLKSGTTNYVNWKKEFDKEIENIKRVGAIATGVLLLLLIFLLLFLLLRRKKRFRENVLNLLANETGNRMSNFKNSIIDVAKKAGGGKLTSTDVEQIVREVLDKQKRENVRSTIEPPKTQPTSIVTPPVLQSQSLYADAIVAGKFNRVKEQPDAETVFELVLNKANDRWARVKIYTGAYQLVIQRPEFLEGCEKQIMGSSTVIMIREGVATRDGSGKWTITTTPEVKIS